MQPDTRYAHNHLPQPKVDWLTWLIALGVFTGVLSVFYYCIFTQKVQFDIQTHIYFLQEALQGKTNIPSNFLFYALSWLGALGSTNYDSLLLAGIVVMAVSVALKYIITARYFHSSLVSSDYANRVSVPILSLVAILIMACTFREDYLLIGYFSPNIWHNSTSIVAMPFVAATFLLSLQYLQNPSRKTLVYLSLLVVAGMAAKPSFYMAFIAGWPLMLLLQRPTFKSWMVGSTPAIVGFTCLALQFYYQYVHASSVLLPGQEPSHLVIQFPFGWFQTYNVHSNRYIIKYLLFSFGFPLSCFLLFKGAFDQVQVRFVLLLFAISMLIFLCIGETGFRQAHANFAWALQASTYLLYIVALAIVVNAYKVKGFTWQVWVALFILSFHFVVSLMYYKRLLIGGVWW